MERKHVSVPIEGYREGSACHHVKSYGPVTLVTVVSVLLAARLFQLISRYAVNIFFSDQWDFNNATLFQKHSFWQMFAWQHGPHRQGLGALLERLVEPLFAWNSRTEAFVVGAVVVIAAIAALLLKRRLYGTLSLFDVVIPALFFTPGQYETLFVTANFAHGPLPLLLLVLYCLAWTINRSASRYPLVLALNFVTIYTGFGLFIGVLTPALLVLDRWATPENLRLPRSLFGAALAVSVASFGSFFFDYKFYAAVTCFSFQPRTPRDYLAYMAIMLAHFFAIPGVGRFSQILGIAVLAALSTALAIAVIKLLPRRNPTLSDSQRNSALIIASLTAYTLLFCLNVAYGRLCGGLLTAQSPRYANYLELGILGLYFHLLDVRRLSIRRWLLSVCLAAVVFGALHGNLGAMTYYHDGKQRWKTCYLQMEDIMACDSKIGFRVYPFESAQAHLQEKLQYLKKSRQNLYADSDITRIGSPAPSN